MPEEKHTILGGKVHVYRRERSRFWQCSTFLNGKNRRSSTKEESLSLAKEFADDWYLTLRGKNARGELTNEYEPPHLNWSSAMFRKRRTDNDEQTTEAGRDYHEVEAS